MFIGQGDQATFYADETGGKAFKDNWLLENMNVVIHRQQSGTDMVTALNLMLAADDYPELITNMPDDMANRFAEQGRAVNLMPLMEDFGYNITRRVGHYLDMLVTEDGHLYRLPVNWGETPNVAGWDFGIRYDLWSELNLPMYTTPDEYFYALLAVMEANPVNEFGEQVFGIGWAHDNNLAHLNVLLTAFGFTGERYRRSPAGDSFTHWTRTEEARVAARLINRMWRYNMIHPDFLSMTYDDYIAHLATGRVIGNLGTWWHAWVGGHEIWAVENPDWCNTERFMNATVSWDGVPIDQTRFVSYNFLGGTRAIITDKSEQVADVLRFINWQNSELGNMIAGWGPPAPTNNWVVSPDGTWRVRDEIMNIAQKNLYFHATRHAHGALIYNIAVNGGWLRTDGRSNFDMIDPRGTRVSIWDYWPIDPATGEFADEGINIAWGNITAPAFDTTLYTVTWDPESPVTWARTSIIENEAVWWAQITTASSEEEAMRFFDEAAAHAELLGVRSVEEFFQSQFDSNRALLGR
jgi:ABC-type glycerol-3-phosphate transport system substrate-binding protein